MVHKYRIENKPMQLPHDAIFLRFDMQDGEPTAWFEIRIDSTKVYKRLFMYGTGQLIPESAMYLGTCIDGDCVWHLYDET